MSKNQPKNPPKELKPPGRALWRTLQSEYGIADTGGLVSLLTVCRAEDDLVRMRKQLAADGDLLTDRFGQRVPHPLIASIRGVEATKRASLAALKLDPEPTKPSTAGIGRKY